MNDRSARPCPAARDPRHVSPGPRDSGGPRPVRPRRPYTSPRLERLGAWHALTLQQSIPIGPGSIMMPLP